MSNKKSLHHFEPTEMVFPHPHVSYVWKECDIDDVGVVLKTIKGQHSKDKPKVIVHWCIRNKKCIYYNDMLYHIHHLNILAPLRDEYEHIHNRGSFWRIHKPDIPFYNPLRDYLKKNQTT